MPMRAEVDVGAAPSAMKSTPRWRGSRWPACITSRPWFQFGKSQDQAGHARRRRRGPRARPRTTPSRRALKRPEGISVPPNIPPSLVSHCQVVARCGMLSFTKMRNMTTSEKMKSGPTKLWRFFATMLDASENAAVAQPRQHDVLAEEDHDPRERQHHEADAMVQWATRSTRVEALDHPPGGLPVQLDRCPCSR